MMFFVMMFFVVMFFVMVFFVMVLVMFFGKFASWVIELWIQHVGDAADNQTIRKDDYFDRYVPGQRDLHRRKVLSADEARLNYPAVAWAKRE
jgi:hypothetical protein